MSKLKFLVGADPELFLFKDGKFHSAHGKIPGDKKNPHKVDSGAIQVDGMALEFNIDPAETEQEFIQNIADVRATLEAMVPGYTVLANPTATFDHEYMLQQPLESKILGCDPDFNAWEDGQRNPAPDGNVDFRTGAGHVHVGWCKGMDMLDEGHFNACIMATKQLDCALGLGSLLYDSDNTRRILYGKAGAFRPKSYGVEYRTLSNAWLNSKERIEWVYRTTIYAMNKLLSGVRFWETMDKAGLPVHKIINGGEFNENETKSEARYWLNHFGIKQVA